MPRYGSRRGFGFGFPLFFFPFFPFFYPFGRQRRLRY